MMNIRRSLLFLTIAASLPLHAGLFDPVSWFKSHVETSGPTKGVYVTFGEDKKQFLARLKEEKAELEKNEKAFDVAISAELERVAQQIGTLKEKIKEGKNSEFLQKRLSLLNEQHQALIDRQLSHKQEITALDQQIKMLEEYLRDPDFKSMMLDAKSFYSFENLQNIAQKIADQDEVASHLEEQKNSLVVELENRKKQLEQASKELKNKEREQKEGVHSEGALFDDHGFDVKQRAELFDLNTHLLNSKKQLLEQKVHEMKRKLGLLETKIFVERTKRKALSDQRINVKEGLRVEESDVQNARADLERKRQIYLETKDALYQKRKNLEINRERHLERFNLLIHQLGITIGDMGDLDELPVEPAEAENFTAFCEILKLKEIVIRFDKLIDQMNAQINLENAQFAREEIAVDFIESWHKLTMRKFRSESEVEGEISKYYEPALLSEQDVNTFIEKRSIATNFLTLQSKVFDSLKQRMAKLFEYAHLFRNRPELRAKAEQELNYASKLLTAQTGINREIIETYSKIIQLRGSIKHQISGIISELQSIGLRPPNAITFEGIKNIPADFFMLWGEVANLGTGYVKNLTLNNGIKKIQHAGLYGIISFLFSLCLLALLFMFLRTALPLASTKLLTVSPDAGNFYYLGRLLSGAIDFVLQHFISLFVWFVLYGLLYFDVIQDIFPRVLFYLISIPFFLIIGRQFLRFIVAFNSTQDYLFVGKSAVTRLHSMVTVALYATVIIFFFRQAFMLASYSKSELPTILLTTYSIIIRIMLISLVTKDDLLEILPSQGDAWEWIREQIERHFYLIFSFLAALLIMSEPHIGYGKYVSYLLWGVVGTIIIIRALLLIQLFVKRYSTVFFFETEGDVQRERFVYAKSAYGLFVISSFIFFAFFAVMIGARIWGYTFTLGNLSDLIHTPLVTIGENTTAETAITTFSLLQMLGFIFGSFVVASAINHFAIRRIFDLLTVDQGVQHTVSTITHYLIVAIVIAIGFQRIGLIYVLLLIIAPVAFAITWSMRDYANDFASYFIILVQRPFKIGDFVRLDNNITGVVRKITPRSIIVREKNSVNVLIPNSKVINGQIINWNYSRSFTAFPDINLAVPFSTDPAETRTIIARALDANMNVLKNPKPIIRLDDFNEQGFVFMIRGFVSSDNVLNMFDIASDVRFALIKALRDHNIQPVGSAVIYKEMTS